MISRKDVLRLKIPFPDISSRLATNSHMYICRNVDDNSVSFVKCQTLKPYMFTQPVMRHFWDEVPDISRNPFLRTTRIDCDKEFATHNVQYDERLRTISRPDVSEDVIIHIEQELICDGYASEKIAEDEIVQLNALATFANI